MLSKALKVVATILFALAVFHVSTRFDMLAAGLLCWVVSELL